jgi:PiT family inorganic phosphate transporter
MEILALLFLTSGLFLGWALGANDAANVFGTAVGTRMVKWRTAAIICSVFVILGAVISGAGASHTLGKLGAISALPGAFMTALSAAIAVYTMTKSGLPVSTSQAIVGAIIGWNLFSGNPTDVSTLTKILSTWIICPVLSAIIAVTLFKALRLCSRHVKVHMIMADAYTRVALILAGSFGAYSLGANNIANVVGVFIPASPLPDLVVGQLIISSTQQLFLLGGLAIALGVFTYSRGVMMTVGGNLGRLSPTAALIAVTSHSIVLFIFASRGLEAWLSGHGLPTIPLVPVSSSQAVVGAIVGISILQGSTGIRWSVLGKIVAGWISTPFVAGLMCFIGLFFLQNVFGLVVM